MEHYYFTRIAKYTQYGFVNADTKEEAMELIRKDKYDYMIETVLEEEYNDTIEIEEDE